MRSHHPSVLGSSLLAAVVAACSPGRASGSDSDASADAALMPAPAAPVSGDGTKPGGAAPSTTGTPGASAKPSSSGEPEEQEEIQLLKLSLASGVKDKAPVDKLTSAKPGQRVWGHVTIRNRTGFAREIDLVFRVNGKERTRVTLNVEPSWSFRTWGYVTLRAADVSGEVTVTVVDDSGEELGNARATIKP